MARYLPHTFRGWLLLVLGVGAALAGYATLLLYATPRWYQPLDPRNPQVIDTAERAQNVFLDLHNKIGRLPQGSQTWSITQDEINSFLAVQAAEGLDPARARLGQISGPMVILEDGALTVAARVAGVPARHQAGGVVTITAGVAARPAPDTGNTRLQVALQHVRLGALPVPATAVEDTIARFSAALAGATAHSVEPALITQLLQGQAVAVPLKYRKHLVQIQDIQITNGKLSITLALAHPESHGTP